MADRVVILCEDARQRDFLNALCRERKLRVVRNLVSPQGAGAAAAWVLRHYVDEVRWLRSQRHQQNLGLIAVVDGDNVGLDGRLRSLANELTLKSLPPRDDDEAIVHLIPTWSIETWLLWLIGVDVDESTRFKNNTLYRQHDPTPRECAKRFLEPPLDTETHECPRSLTRETS